LGNSPSWYKNAIIAFLLINPLLVMIPDIGYTVAGWALGMTSPGAVKHEIIA
jgi:NhaB family Na+:H+ antiporter